MNDAASNREPSRTGRFLASALTPMLLVAAACSDESSAAPARRVILISCDTLRADRLGVYGYPRGTSPKLDAFARDAVVFDAAYSCAPLTGPALSSLMTGRVPDELGVPGNRFPLPPAAVTLAEIARDAGIATAAVVSNWVLRRPAAVHGDAGVAQGFQHFDDHMTARERNRRDHYERVAPDTTQAAITWLQAQKSTGSDRFFLWVHYQDPHGPYVPPPELEARFRRPPSDEPALTPGKNQKGRGQLPVYQVLEGDSNPERYRALYDAEISYFDQGFGTLLEWLAANGWYEDSLIVFTADHGESLGEHDYWFCHGENVYREEVRVPLVVHYPRGARRPTTRTVDGFARADALVSHLDLWSTVLEAFALAPRPNRGTSLFAQELPRDRIAVHTLDVRMAPRWEGITSERYRCVIEAQQPARLFDLRADPQELIDLASSQPALVTELLERREAFIATYALPTLQAHEPKLDPVDQRAMQQLGYTDGADDDD